MLTEEMAKKFLTSTGFGEVLCNDARPAGIPDIQNLL
jgi:hypothetical protein